MKRILIALLMALTVGCAGKLTTPSVEVLRPAFLSAIKPVQYLTNGGQALRNGCSAFSINRAEHYWMTAAHCVQEGEMYIASEPATLVEGYADLDVAVLHVPAYTAGGELGRAVERPRFGMDIMIAGHPLGYEDVFLTRGYVANPEALLNDGSASYKESLPFPILLAAPKWNGFMVFDVAAAPGNSGSAVLNMKGEVVSVLQIGWGRSFSPVTGGATYSAVEWFDRYFVKPNPTARP